MLIEQNRNVLLGVRLLICFDLQAFISEAENLLNPALSKLDFSEGVSWSYSYFVLLCAPFV